MKKTISSKTSQFPKRTQDMYATQKMLHQVRDQLKAHTNSKFHELNSKLHENNAKFHEVNARFDKVDSHFESFNSLMQKMTSEIHRNSLLVEQQDKLNQIVLEGYARVTERQEQFEGVFYTRFPESKT